MANPAHTARGGRRRAWGAAVPALLLGILLLPLPFPVPEPARFGVPGPPPPGPGDSVPVVAGARYQAGALRRFFLGRHHREIWTEPANFPVLRIDQNDSGLTPVREGGGKQTRTLHLVSDSGRRFVFRSTDKTLRLLPGFLNRSVLGRILQDQVSSAHPAAPVVAGHLERALGIPGSIPRLVVLCDHPRLGAFRPRFAGLLGTIQERGARDSASASTGELLARLDSFPAEQVDARGFLRARLLDFLLNDWDRHQGQWNWVPDRSGVEVLWRPVPVDRDQALSWYDGLVPAAVRVFMPKLVSFGPEFPSLRGLTTNSRALDRRILRGFSRAAWDSVTREVARELTDSVLRSAVAAMPEPWWKRSGSMILGFLIQRRDRLPQIADRFHAAIH